MRRTSRTRRVLSFAAALTALVLSVQPVAAETVINETGRWGYYEVYDNQDFQRGANCFYETGTFDLDKITVRPPMVHGDYAQNTWIGWRFLIQRNAPPVDDNAFATIFKSTIQKDRANDQLPADAFVRRAWVAPENPTGFYRVRIVIFWYAPGSQTNVEGKAVVEYDWYKAKWSGNFYVNENHCLPDY